MFQVQSVVIRYQGMLVSIGGRLKAESNAAQETLVRTVNFGKSLVNSGEAPLLRQWVMYVASCMTTLRP